MLYKLDELTEGSAFEQEYDRLILEGKTHVDAVEAASAIVEELTPKKVLGYALIIKNYRAEIDALKVHGLADVRRQRGSEVSRVTLTPLGRKLRDQQKRKAR